MAFKLIVPKENIVMSLATFNERVTYAHCVAANDDANTEHNNIENVCKEAT